MRNGLSSRPENPTLVSMTVYAVYSFEYINTRLNFRNFVSVNGCSCSDAGDAARKMLGPEGYDRIESIVCVGYAK